MKLPFSTSTLKNSSYELTLMGIIIAASTAASGFLEQGKIVEALISLLICAVPGAIIIVSKYHYREKAEQDDTNSNQP